MPGSRGRPLLVVGQYVHLWNAIKHKWSIILPRYLYDVIWGLAIVFIQNTYTFTVVILPNLIHKMILNISLNLMKGSYFVPCESWTVISYLGKKLDTSMRKYFKGGLKIVNIFAKRKSCHGKFKDGPKTFFYLWSQTRCHPSFEAAKTNLNCHHLSARRDWL